MNHTPGPWYAEEIDDNDSVIKSKVNGATICRISAPFFDTESEKNAELIMAAPDLLEALKALTKEINLGKLNIQKDFSLINFHACAIRAIRKAEGVS